VLQHPLINHPKNTKLLCTRSLLLLYEWSKILFNRIFPQHSYGQQVGLGYESAQRSRGNVIVIDNATYGLQNKDRDFHARQESGF
jgi:hypothetical protein